MRLLVVLLILGFYVNGQAQVHVWEKVELVLEAQNAYKNPYKEVEVWIDLKGPDFNKRCYGFWDGENIWKIRIMATDAGMWSWTSGSNQHDAGLNNKQGSFKAIEWTEAEKRENSLRRGMIRPTANGHAFKYTDGTPMFWLADTWWPCMTQKYHWYEDDRKRAVGTQEAGFKDYVRYRKAQGYNGCMVIAGFPNWTDIAEEGQWRGGNWEDEDGNRTFFGEEGTPDLEHLNPAYFQNMDKKVDYLNANGFIPFIETARRDIGPYWKENFGWPESYSRYIRYICFRYQGNIIINSPIHLDWMTLSGKEWNEAANILIDRYDWPPFDHQASANPPGSNRECSGSTLDAFGHTGQAKWLTFHSVGNCRNHNLFPVITEIFFHDNPVPCLNNEPYYDGLMWGDTAVLGSDLAAYYSRVGLYGSVLSGALAGHVYGAHNIWNGNNKMPSAFLVQSAEQMQYINRFLFSEGNRYQDLVPAKKLLVPNQTPNKDANKGWAYCMRTETKDLFLLYFEIDSKIPILNGMIPNTRYTIQWFDPIKGCWSKEAQQKSNKDGEIEFTTFPDSSKITTKDWGVKVKRSM